MKKTLTALLSALSILGCAAHETFRDGRYMVEAGNEEEGLARIEEALKKDPQNPEIRNYYLRNKAVAVQRYLAQGDAARSAGALEQAEGAYRRAQRFDPDNARAREGLEALARDRDTQAAVAEANAAMKRGDTQAAEQKAREILEVNPAQKDARAIVRKLEEHRVKAESMPPQLGAALKNTITIELRDAPVRTVLELISKRSGLNFVYDKDVPADLKTTVFVRDSTIEDVIRFVLVTAQLERRVLNPTTVLIYPNTPQKSQAYKELVVKSFYLGNADAKQTATMVRQLAKTRDLYVDEKLNLLVVRDTPEAVRMVEKLVASQDIAEPEVMLEVEVLEVGHTQLTQMGIQWPTSIGLSLLGAAGVPGQVTGKELGSLNGNNARVTVSDPLLALNLRQQAGRTNVLANPRIRVKNKEKARIHIGDKVPVITTTAGATGFVSEAVNYLDVGLKLEVEPLVYLEDDVGIKIGLEVSNIASQIRSPSGTVTYQVGTRNANTTLRLRDGETQVLAGLISNEDRRSANKVPGLSELPVLGRLFSNNDDTVNKTEVVLLITPRVIRNIERPGVRVEEFNSGTELEIGGAGPSLPSAPAAPPSAAAPAPARPATAGQPGPSSVPSYPAAPAQGSLPPTPPGPLPPAAGPQSQPPQPQQTQPQ